MPTEVDVPDGKTPVKAELCHRELGSAKGEFVVPDDFNAPLPDHILAEFER